MTTMEAAWMAFLLLLLGGGIVLGSVTGKRYKGSRRK